MAPESTRRNHLYGGQALIEGVMMRGKDVWAAAIRRPDGEIHTEAHDINSVVARHPFLGKPGLRGVIALGQAMSIGYKALMVSADQAQPDEEKLSGWQMGLSMTAAIVLFLGVFWVLPIVLVNAAEHWWKMSVVLEAFIEGLMRVAMFLGYLAGIGRIKDIRRTFEYHGAEHKTIAAFEHEEILIPENVDRYSTVHVRCGTNFLFLTFMVAVVVFALLSAVSAALWWKIAVRIVGIPIIAAAAYEMLRLGARFEGSRVMRVLMAPGLWLQRITTKPPDRSQIEVAIASFQAVSDRESEKLAGNS